MHILDNHLGQGNQTMTASNLYILLTINLILLFTLPVYGQIKAFPGAEGFGAYTPGGRGGKIIEVTNLNDKGPGSFRAACEDQGPRILIFKVGGTLKLSIDIYINNPYITIAGQTAPGDGILIRGAAIRPSTHDVIIRGLRIRVGDDLDGPDFNNRDGLSIENNSAQPYNIIIDHCSLSWATDENVVIWYKSRDITIQWCIISESLMSADGEAGYGALLGSLGDRISMLHNLLAHNRGRNPLAQGGPGRFEIINNLIYNWGVQPIALESKDNQPASANIIGNYMIPGPNTDFSWIKKGIWLQTGLINTLSADSKIYVKDNLGPGRMNDSLDDWASVDGPETYRSIQPIMNISDCMIYPTKNIYKIILQNAGANVPWYDLVDERIIDDVNNTTGALLELNLQLRWPEIANGNYPQDSDHDGLPDQWETIRGYDPFDMTDATFNQDKDDYSPIEEYINSLIPLIDYIDYSLNKPSNLKIEK
jgi:hypothetical protein